MSGSGPAVVVLSHKPWCGGCNCGAESRHLEVAAQTDAVMRRLVAQSRVIRPVGTDEQVRGWLEALDAARAYARLTETDR